MSAEELREQVDNAVKQAIAGNADVDEIATILSEAQQRLEVVREYEEAQP